MAARRVLFGGTRHPRRAGDDASRDPIAGEAADAYKKVCKGATINLNYGQGKDSAYGVSQVAQAVSSHSTQAGSMIAMYDGVTTLAKGLTPDPVGVLIYSVVAHGAISGSDISVAELK